MRSTTKLFWAVVAFGAGLAVWLWRSAQAREAADQALSTARTTLSNTQAFSPVPDAVSKVSDAAKPAVDQVKEAASTVGDAVKPAVDQAKETASTVGDAVKPAVDQAKEAVNTVSDAVAPVTEQVKQAASAVSDAVNPAVDQVKDAVRQTGDTAKPAAEQVRDAIKPGIDQAKDAVSQVDDVVKPVIDQAMDEASQTADVVTPTVDQAMEAAHQFGDEVEPVVDQDLDAAGQAADAGKPVGETPAPQPASQPTSAEPPTPATATPASAPDADDLAPHDEDIAGVLDLDGVNLTITQRVLSNIGHEATLDGVPHINVNTEEGGVVFLRGIVFTQEQREFAELVAATTEGVESVVNELNIEPGTGSSQQPATSSLPTEAVASSQATETTGSQEPDDEDVAGILDLDGENLTITQRVRSHFGHEPVLADLPHININTQERGVVYLRGVVHSQEQWRLAQEVASRAEGVQSVVNELNVE